MKILRTLRFIVKHPANQGRKLRAVLVFCYWQVISRLKREVEFEWIMGSRLIVKRGMTGATGNLYCGLHEFEDMAFLLHFLRQGDLFLDVGANVGSYTVLASSVCRCRTISIEPDPDTVRNLKRNIHANEIGQLCEIHQTAVGAMNGRAKFSVGRDTLNRVCEDGDGEFREVPIKQIDCVVSGRRVQLMKMDIEGYERKALMGAKSLLESDHLMAVIIEDDSPEVVGELQKHGFIEYSYNPFNRSLREHSQKRLSGNGLFIRDIGAVRRRLNSASSFLVNEMIL